MDLVFSVAVSSLSAKVSRAAVTGTVIVDWWPFTREIRLNGDTLGSRELEQRLC